MLPIKKMISPYNHYDYNNPKYIVLHYTGNSKDTAYNNAKYFNGGNRNASAHYFVDDTSIFQVVEDYNGAWHVGNTKTEVNNKNSIGIEMCCSGNYQVSSKTEANAIELVKHLMAKYNIPVANVRTHAEVTKYGKTCPNWNANNWQRWKSFKAKLVDKPVTTTKPQAPTQQEVNKVNYTVRIKVSSLNVRQYPSLDAKVITTVRKNEVYTITEEKWSGGVKFGHLKSGRGWISLGADYVEKNNQTTKANSFRVKVVNCTSLNARKEPNGKIVETVKKGTILTIVGEVDGWYRTKSGLFVSKTYCQRLDG